MPEAALEKAPDLLLESRVDPGGADEQKAESDEGEDAAGGIEFAEVVEEEFGEAEQEQGEGG